MHANRVVAVAVAFTVLVGGKATLAQDIAVDAGVDAEVDAGMDAAPELIAPRLVEFFEAVYPEEAEQAGLEGVVELELTISAEGEVSEASVVSSAGHGFDEAASAAARQFRFEPARRNGEAVPAIIRYRYIFELQPPTESTPRGDLAGQVVTISEGERHSVSGAAVTITSLASPEETAQTFSGSDGEFYFADLPPGDYRVDVDAGDRGISSEVETVLQDQVTEVIYSIGEVVDVEGYGVTALVERPPREVTRRTIERDQLTRIPGTRGDALRAVEVLPGVARPPFGVGTLLVRGSAPGDSETLLEGAPIPFLYHFGGLTSVFQSRLLSQLDFYPGNFSARYGRRTGGILEASVRDPAMDRVHAVAEFSLIDTSLLLEFPIGDRFGMALAVRRSLIDLAFEYLVPDDSIDVLAAPVYWDYQLVASWRPTDRDHLRFMFYGSSDAFELFLSEAVGDDPTIRGNTDLRTMFHFLQLSWDRELSARVDQEIDLQVGPVIGEFALGDTIRFAGRFQQIRLRSEWRARLHERVRLIAGLDVDLLPLRVDFRGPQLRQSEGGQFNGDPLASDEIIELTAREVIVRPAFYVEGDFQLADPLQVILGLRVDYYGEIDDWSFDPRLTVLYRVTDALRLKLGAGIYSQPPDPAESTEEIGNPGLDGLHSVHVGAGFEYDLAEGISLGVEGFYKYLWDRVIGTDRGVEPYFVNGGIGRIYGMEVSGRIHLGDRFFGYLSYTLSRSLRQDGEDEPVRFFDFDQPHILNLAGVVNLGRGWEMGATLRVVSGNPYTPIVGAVYDADHGVYQPLNGDPNSERNPVFHRLDVRIQKQWTFETWRLALFLDVQNVYNARNQEGIVHNYDFTEQTPISGLPIIPALGLRGEL